MGSLSNILRLETASGNFPRPPRRIELKTGLSERPHGKDLLLAGESELTDGADSATPSSTAQVAKEHDEAARPDQRRSPEAAITAGFGVALLTLAVVGFVQHRSIEVLTATDGMVAHTHTVLTELEAVYASILESDEGTGGFIATAQQDYLNQQEYGLETCKKHLHALRLLTADNRRQQQTLDELEPLAERRAAVVRQVVLRRREQGLEAASNYLRAEEPMKLMVETRRLLDSMKAEETRLRAERQAASQVDARWSNTTILVGTLLALALIFAAGWRTRQFNRQLENEVEEREKAQREVYNLNRNLEERVTERTAELAASNKELEAFAYSVSHDLRAPLRHMDAFLALLVKSSRGVLDATSFRYLDKVTEASHTMGLLIDDLLQFSRLGRNEMAKTAVNLGRLVQEIRLELEADAADRTIVWDIGSLPEVVGDRAMLRLAIANLVSNALKFTRGRGLTRIEIGCRAGNASEDVIFVKDNGVGFDARYAGKLFNVFQRLHPAEDFEGTGVGLANVRRIIERHGGEVWAESVEGAGATFSFSLPRFTKWGTSTDEKPKTHSAGGG